MTYTLRLADLLATLASVGGKGASLARLAGAGLPVPDGFHITTAAYRRFVAENNLQPGILAALEPADAASPDSLEAAARTIRGLFEQGTIPADVVAAIADAYEKVTGADASVAVRSSATAEDLPEASFAGQQETFLNVSGMAAVLDAVKRCWASLWTARAIAYRARQGIPPDHVALSVVVQHLVPAEAAGILFTANPVTGNRGQIVINAAWGLGDAIVGGRVTPDTLTVDRASGRIVARDTADKQVMTVRADGGTRDQPVPDALRQAPVLSELTAAELTRLGEQIEALYAMPMDVEWALADGRIAILQARPITALPEPEQAPPTEWKLPAGAYIAMRNNIVELMAEPLTPLFATLGRAAINTSLGRLLRDFFGRSDVMPPEIIITVNQYAYFNGSLSVGAMARLMLGSIGIARRMFSGAVKRWTEVGRPRYVATVADWEGVSWRDLPAVEVISAVRELAEAAIDGYGAIVGGVIPAAWISEGLFTLVYKTLIKRREDPPAPFYLLGFDSTPIQAEKSLYDLAQWARTRDGLAAFLLRAPAVQILATGDDTPAGVEADDWRAWQVRYQAHLRQFGHTIYSLDFADPVQADDPALLLETCKLYLAGQGTNPYARQQAAVERRDQATQVILGRLTGRRGRLFQRVLAPAQKYAPLREDALADIGLAYPLLRTMLAELGRRFVAEGMIDEPDDIYWLTQDEVEQAAAQLDRGEGLTRLAFVVPQRKAGWRAAQRVSPPRSLPQLRRGRKGPQTGRRRPEETIKGVAASPGSVTARACVLRGPEDFEHMRPGDVLVAAITTPAWTPLFAMAAAVVTDVGGPLSHGSIVAREYGIPAVLGTGCATRQITNEQLITVDGTAGCVRLHASPVAWTLPDPKAWYARSSLCEHLPDPVSPLYATMGVRLANAATDELMGIMTTDRIEYGYKVINGYLYLGTRLGWRELWLYLKMSVSVLRMVLQGSTTRWLAARQRLQAVVDTWEARSAEALSAGELLDGARELLLEASRFYTVIQAGTLPAATGSETVFRRAYRLVSRDDDPDPTTFLFGFDTVPIQAEKSLYDLAMAANDAADLRTYLLETPTPDIVAALRTGQVPAGVATAAWAGWCGAFDDHLVNYGQTVYEFDIANPTPREAPDPLLQAVKMYLAGKGINPHARQRMAVERREGATAQVLSHAHWPFKSLFRKSLNWVQRVGPVREDSLADLGMAHPQIRRLLGELGRRLAEGGAIVEAGDIYWLYEEEVDDLVGRLARGESLPNLAADVEARWQEVRVRQRLIAPAVLPERSRLAKMLPWSEQYQRDQTVLKGSGTSAGTVTGRACVLFGPEDFANMHPGDVLVAVTTTPAWTPLFAMASAVVTDIGGPLSHSSIVAREYGIPAVMATGLATRRIHSGQVITVDGSAGVVLLSNGHED